MCGGARPLPIQGGSPAPHLVAQELFRQSPEGVVDQEASGQVDQLELLQGSVDLQLGGGERRHAGLRGHRHVHAWVARGKGEGMCVPARGSHLEGQQPRDMGKFWEKCDLERLSVSLPKSSKSLSS